MIIIITHIFDLKKKIENELIFWLLVVVTHLICAFTYFDVARWFDGKTQNFKNYCSSN